ncbi:hypothetical protein FEE95_06385 [Maribacter algarum]|uniref:Uncharacterized protein n=1 Tax=Maribacter algarum (ex Zhang et al. 2020) TaxID=2578118 RepID=A0A5S3PVY0_9FLAO|nr:hypothetical protein [Maribacter algarum]TMM59058.1 hypothetical protein FEE95_06385 [Maribacter algarum]
MNDLSKKEVQIGEIKARNKEVSASSDVFQKKLENLLILYYQGYLKGETEIEPEIRTTFLHLVKQDEEFAFKVRMLQLDYLKLENSELEGEWNEATEELFPKTAILEKPVDVHREKTLTDYKETIFELLKSTSELRS